MSGVNRADFILTQHPYKEPVDRLVFGHHMSGVLLTLNTRTYSGTFPTTLRATGFFRCHTMQFWWLQNLIALDSTSATVARKVAACTQALRI